MRGGHIRHYRKEMESYVWSLKPAYYKVWQTILLSVNWKESTMDFGGEPRTIKPGQMVTGRHDLAELAGQGVTPSQVKRALEKFEAADMIERESSNKGTLLTVVNWSKYQVLPDDADSNRPASGQQPTSERTASGQQSTTYEEGNKGNKEKKEKEVFDYFVDKDELTSHRKMTGAFKSTLSARLDDGWTVEEMKEAIDNYCRMLRDQEKDGCKIYGIHNNWSIGQFFKREEGEKANQILNDPDSFYQSAPETSANESDYDWDQSDELDPEKEFQPTGG